MLESEATSEHKERNTDSQKKVEGQSSTLEKVLKNTKEKAVLTP